MYWSKVVQGEHLPNLLQRQGTFYHPKIDFLLDLNAG